MPVEVFERTLAEGCHEWQRKILQRKKFNCFSRAVCLESRRQCASTLSLYRDEKRDKQKTAHARHGT